MARLAQYGAPDFAGSILQGLEAGQHMRQRNRLAELDEQGRQLAGQVLGGQKNKLAELMAVDPDRGMKIQQFTDQQKKDFLEDFSRQAYAADTAPKWQAMIDRYKAQGHQFSPGEDLFDNRDALITSAMSVGDRLGLDLRRDDARRAQANADRSYALDVRQFEAGERHRQAQEAAKAPDLVELYDDATGQPYKARYNPQTRGFDRVGGVKAPSGTQLEVGPDGAVSFTQGMGKPPNEGQGKDIGFLTRMTGAMDSLDKNETALLSLGENVAGRAPLVGNYAKSPQYQKAEQAGSEFLTGLLRKDSGGAITPAEEAFYGGMYLPKPGDSKEVLAQKREARKRAALGIKMGLPAHLIATMEKNGVDFTALNPADATTGKGDKGGASPNRTQNGINWSID